MSASIIAVGHWRRFRVKGSRILPLLAAAVALLHAAVVVAAEAPGKPVLDRANFYLSSAGFRIRVANDPAGQRAMRALPAHRFVAEGAGDAARYYYAEPDHCVCIFVGTAQAYDRYRRMVSQPVRPTDNAPADYKTQAGVLLSGQPLRIGTRGDPTTLTDYLDTLRPAY